MAEIKCSPAPAQWICCQIGAREHYAIPRVLRQRNELSLLVTDAWADTRLPWKVGGNTRAAERFHADINSSLVESFDWQLLRFELTVGRRLSGWSRTMARNEWFQTRAISALRRFRDRNPGAEYTLFSYSYAAAKLFQFARDSGWSTVLGQIDPGRFEENLLMNLHRESGRGDMGNAAPSAYWDNWRDECQLADRIIVNSEWSRHGLESEGVPGEKIHVVPLAYDIPHDARDFIRKYPVKFDDARPLRILFLGQVNLRKGLTAILGAISRLEKLPVEFWMVGDLQTAIPSGYKDHPRVKWMGAVPRGATAGFYRDADVFLFPTLSDGFGLTQLEAQAWRLPVITSRQCGDVVENGVNGYLLPTVSPGTITQAIESMLASPHLLSAYAARSRAHEFTLDKLYPRLVRATMEGNSCCNC